MSTNLTDFYVNLRTALADVGRGGVYRYKNESLDGALVSVVQMGLGPKGVAVAAAGTALDPAPETPDSRGYLIFQAALLLVGGQQPFSLKTRALQTRVDPLERMLTVEHLRRQIQRLESQGDPHGNGGASCFGVWNDLENALSRTTEVERVV